VANGKDRLEAIVQEIKSVLGNGYSDYLSEDNTIVLWHLNKRWVVVLRMRIKRSRVKACMIFLCDVRRTWRELDKGYGYYYAYHALPAKNVSQSLFLARLLKETRRRISKHFLKGFPDAIYGHIITLAGLVSPLRTPYILYNERIAGNLLQFLVSKMGEGDRFREERKIHTLKLLLSVAENF